MVGMHTALHYLLYYNDVTFSPGEEHTTDFADFLVDVNSRWKDFEPIVVRGGKNVTLCLFLSL
jgi:hypothetical protein